MHIFRIADGKLVECWAEADMLGVLQQLGAIPTPG
jgi:predicted ester cyclase